MACHMVALPAAYINTVGWECKGADDKKDGTQRQKHSDVGRDWLNCLAVAAGGAEASYDWLGESAAWAAMTTPDEAAIQSVPIEQLPRIETIAIESPRLSCATTPTPTSRCPNRPIYSSIKAPWVRTSSLRCTPRDTPAGACAPRSTRAATVSQLTSSNSNELLTNSPSIMITPRLRGLAQLAQGSEQPHEPTRAPPPPRSPSVTSSSSPSILVLELEQNVSVTNTKLENGVGLYEITWSDRYDRLHTVWRRYSDFSALHMSLCDDRMVGESVESIDFPPKRPLSSFSHAQRERLLAERRDGLENYLTRLVLEGIVSPDKSDVAAEQLKAFLMDDDSEEC